MSRIQLDEDIQPLSEFRANVTSFIDKVRETKRPMVITQRGKSAAILMYVSEYEALMQKIELLTDIQVAEKQIADELGIKHEDAKKQIRSRLGWPTAVCKRGTPCASSISKTAAVPARRSPKASR